MEKHDVAVETDPVAEAKRLVAEAQQKKLEKAEVAFNEFMTKLDKDGFRLSTFRQEVDGKMGPVILRVVPKE